MLQICTLQGVDDNENPEEIDLSFLSCLNINYRQIKWKNVAALVVLHCGGLAGWFLFIIGYISWQTVLWNGLFGFVSIIGITAGALSLWSHRTYDPRQPLKLFLLIAQTVASQGRIWTWVRDHRQHCQFNKTDADPFNSKRGFFFAHMGWFMTTRHPDVITKGKQSDMSDLEIDSLVMFQNREEKSDAENRTLRQCLGVNCCWFDPTSIVLYISERIGLISCPKKTD
ncbi:stearoyl-CoA desaturase isoform X2 [Halyomorpha halys]|uniref:stearoyl-CoA desaturase isoform X2 n=1 Tax=Halyomorpha halys TaxID=286706 RepID=UPI0034D29798